jgi:hypothetical protein
MNGERQVLPARTTGCRRTRLLLAMACLLAARAPLRQEPCGGSASVQPDQGHPHLLGVQATEVVQATPRFTSPHAGANSLRGGDVGLSQTYTLYLGIRVIDGLDVYLEPEAATGRAPGQGMGLAGYGNGDLLRRGEPARRLRRARVMAASRLEETIPATARAPRGTPSRRCARYQRLARRTRCLPRMRCGGGCRSRCG